MITFVKASTPIRIAVTLSVFGIAALSLFNPDISKAAEESAVDAELRKTIEYSHDGVGILLLLSSGDTVGNNKQALATVMQRFNAEKIPAYIRALNKNEGATEVVFYVEYRDYPDGALSRPGISGYALDATSLERLVADARVAYGTLAAKREAQAREIEAYEARIRAIDGEIADLKDKI